MRRTSVKFLLWLATGVAVLGLPNIVCAKEDPVRWTMAPAAGGKAVVAPGGQAYFELKASVDAGWHLYSPTTPPGGPIITKIQVTPNPLLAREQDFSPAAGSQARPELQRRHRDIYGRRRFPD